MGRSPCCAKVGLNRGAWTALEDKILSDYIQVHGQGRWKQLPKNAGLKRCGKSCRLRWLNYLRPDIKRGNISEDEEDLIVRLHKLLGNRWSLIAGRIPGRTDNEIKNYWNTNLSKKAQSSLSLSTVAANPNKSTQNTKPKNTANSNAMNTMSSATFGPSSSTRVFRARATRCSKVVVHPQPQPPPPPQALTSNVITGHDQVHQAFVGDSLFDFDNELPVEDGSVPDFTHLLYEGDVDDLSLGDFCFSDFLNTDQFDDNQIIADNNNKKDCGFLETADRAHDGHGYQGQMGQSSSNVGSDMNPQTQLCPLFVDSYDNSWDL